RGLPVTVETCPHYLTFTAEEIADGDTPYKCAPPIRERENREALWDGLGGGVIDLVASDHSPCPPGLKRLDTGDLMSAWGGIASLEVTLSAVWTGARARGLAPGDVARWMAQAPARLAGLGGGGGWGLGVTLEAFDRLSETEARAALERCCGCRAWVEGMLARRPFGDAARLRESAERVWRALPPEGWREAFAHHPRIGDSESLR